MSRTLRHLLITQLIVILVVIAWDLAVVHFHPRERTGRGPVPAPCL